MRVNYNLVKGFLCRLELDYVLATTCCRKNGLDMTVFRMRPYAGSPLSLKRWHDKDVSQLKGLKRRATVSTSQPLHRQYWHSFMSGIFSNWRVTIIYIYIIEQPFRKKWYSLRPKLIHYLTFPDILFYRNYLIARTWCTFFKCTLMNVIPFLLNIHCIHVTTRLLCQIQ